MAEWSRKKVNSGNINNGKEYEKDDNVVREQLNAMVNTGLYSQDFAEKLVTNIDTSEVGNVGTPSVSLITGDGATTDKPYKKFKFSNLKGATGATGNGIISISKTGTSKLVDTYTISFTSGATTTFQVTNGKGITKIEKTATSGLVDTYTITFNDTTTSTFQVTNGAKGDKGDKGDTGVTPNITATATTLPAGSSATVTKSGTAENPAFAFGIPKGEKGDKGEKGEKGDSGTVVSVNGEEKTSINTDTTPTANSQNLVTSGGVHDYPAVTFAESERQKSVSDGAIVHEKEIADVEHIETIYDMSSSDSNINWGNTSGILLYDALNIVHDFSGFKKYDFIYEPNTRSDNWYCSARTITVHDAIAGDWVFTYFDCVSPSSCYAENLGGIEIYTQFRMASDKQSVSVISSKINSDGNHSNITSGFSNFYRLVKIVGYK